MRVYKTLLVSLFLTVSFSGCGKKSTGDPAPVTPPPAPGGSGGGGGAADVTAPTVSLTSPADGDTDVAVNRGILVTFDEAVDAATITEKSFTLRQGEALVAGGATAVDGVATFKPAANLTVNTAYTATITTEVKDLAGNAVALDKTWTFTTGADSAAGPAPVTLGLAATFAILSKAGITNVATSAIMGDIGSSPISGSAIVGLDCVQVVGKIYEVDPTGPACGQTDSVRLTTAVGDMETAYTDAAGRPSPDATELGAGQIGGLTIAPGLYKWGTDVAISTEVKLSGGAKDVWIFQIAGDLVQANGINVTLIGGALAKNIFWQVGGQVTIGTTAHIDGTILSKTLIALKTGAAMDGRALAQTAVTLESNSLHRPE